jgi:hypothetical protein
MLVSNPLFILKLAIISGFMIYGKLFRIKMALYYPLSTIIGVIKVSMVGLCMGLND